MNLFHNAKLKRYQTLMGLLCSARICHRIKHSVGRGVPLVAQENESAPKGHPGQFRARPLNIDREVEIHPQFK